MHREPWRHLACVSADGERVAFVTDVHLRAGDAEGSALAAGFFRALSADRVVLLGDLFDLYWGPEALRDPAWQSLLSALDALSRRAQVAFLEGNRDFLVGPELLQRTKVAVCGEFLALKQKPCTVLCCHGDQLCREDRSYQRLKRVLRAPALLALWRRLPAVVRYHLARALRGVTLRQLAAKPDAVLLPSAAVLQSIVQCGYNLVVTGHRHRMKKTSYGGALHLELPAWEEEHSFCLLEEGMPRFCRYEGGAGIRLLGPV